MLLKFLLKDAVSISLSCDKRNTRFVLRFRASDRHLNVMSGIFAISQKLYTVQVPGADSYRQAVLQGLLHAATPKTKLPGPAATAGPHSGNETDAFRLVENVEHFVVGGGGALTCSLQAASWPLVYTCAGQAPSTCLMS